jgi:hypothetical protein
MWLYVDSFHMRVHVCMRARVCVGGGTYLVKTMSLLKCSEVHELEQ